MQDRGITLETNEAIEHEALQKDTLEMSKREREREREDKDVAGNERSVCGLINTASN